MIRICWMMLGILLLNSCQEKPKLHLENGDDELIIGFDSVNLLTYRKSIFYPANIDSIYARSAFIHPLKTFSGKVLTQINPEGHLHHYGLWNPWTHVLYRGDTLDFWNLDRRLGTVAFDELANWEVNESIASFQVKEQHLSLKSGKREVVFDELKTVSLRFIDNRKYHLDFEIELVPAIDTVTLLEWRYGGFCWRTPADWTDKTTMVLTSESNDRLTADGSKVKWVAVQKMTLDQQCGMVMMSHPENKNHPEPLRLWPPNTSNKGQMMVNFSPTKYEDWRLLPGEKYVLKYRLIVYDGLLNSQEINSLYNNYLN